MPVDIVNVFSDDLEWETASYHIASRYKNLETEQIVDGIRMFFVEVAPGGRVMLHAHEAEVLFVLGGEGVFTLGRDKVGIARGDRIVVPQDYVQGVVNTGSEPLRLLAARQTTGLRFYLLKLREFIRRFFV